MNLVKHFKIFDAGNPREQRGAFFEKKNGGKKWNISIMNMKKKLLNVNKLFFTRQGKYKIWENCQLGLTL